MPLSGAPASTGRMSVAARVVDLGAAYRGVAGAMRERGRCLVAFSGGVDSGLVARIARDALDTGALAAISDAESLSRRELEDALSDARAIGVARRGRPGPALPSHGKPSNSCLSSRIVYGEGITLEKLRRVEAAEVALHALGFPVVRVRSHEAVARIEVPLEDLPRLLSRDVAERVVDEVRRAGFLHVSVDLRGYRSGSVNEGL